MELAVGWGSEHLLRPGTRGRIGRKERFPPTRLWRESTVGAHAQPDADETTRAGAAPCAAHGKCLRPDPVCWN